MAANTFWTDARLAAQRPSARALALPTHAPQAEAEFALPVAASRRRTLTLPSWAVFCMIMLATFAVCVTVTMRTHAEMRTAENNLQRTSADVERIRNTNASLRQRVEQLQSDPLAIEAAARERLNMVRPNEVIVPLN